ncbi:MAG: porin [Pseudomonadota bacterium]
MKLRSSDYRATALFAGALAVGSFAIACPAGAAENIKNGQDKVKLVIGGHVAKAVLFAGDGKASRTLIVDNAAATTRFNFSADAPVNDDFSFGSQFEAETPANNASVVTIHEGNGDTNRTRNTFTGRKAEVMMTDKRFGKIWLGLGSVSTDEIVEADLSGTAVSGNYADSATIGTAFVFYNPQTRTWDGPAVGDVVVSLNGNNDDRIRYDTPTYGGFFASAAFVSGGAADAALRYAGKAGPFEFAAAIGYYNLSGINTTVDNQVVGSASVLHESGLNLSFSAGRREHKDAARDDGKSLYGKIGYIAKLFGVGPTAFGIDYGVYDDYGQNNDEAKQYSIGVVQHFEEIGSQIYLLGKAYELDRTDASFDDIRLVMAGARVVF